MRPELPIESRPEIEVKQLHLHEEVFPREVMQIETDTDGTDRLRHIVVPKIIESSVQREII